MKNTKKGFTLVELIVVLAILAVIAAIAVPTAFGSVEHARKTVCENNRTVMCRVTIEEELLQDIKIIGTTLDKFIKDNEAVCPSGGRLLGRRVNTARGLDSIFITCSYHGAMPGDNDTTYISRGLLLDYQNWVTEKFRNGIDNNDELRKEFYKAFGNKWPTLTVDGTTYYIQPFFQDSDSKGGSNIVEDRTWLYATPESSSDSGKWFVPYVLNPNDNKWYEATLFDGSSGGSRGITFDNVADLERDLNSTHSNGTAKYWKELNDYTETASNPLV